MCWWAINSHTGNQFWNVETWHSSEQSSPSFLWCASNSTRLIFYASNSGHNQHVSSMMVPRDSSRTSVANELVSTHMSSSLLLTHHSPFHRLAWLTLSMVSVSILLNGVLSIVSHFGCCTHSWFDDTSCYPQPSAHW